MKQGVALLAGVMMLMAGAAGADPATPVTARALLEPVRHATLAAEIQGRILEMPFQEGKAFPKGAPLVTFDCTYYQAQLGVAEAERTGAAKKLENSRQLLAMGSIGALEVELARADLAKFAAQARQYQFYVDRCVLPAPFAGRVVALAAQAHETVAMGKPLLEILDDSELELKLLVPSHWLSWLKPGARLLARIDETGVELPALVSDLGARIDPVSQSLRLTARWPSPPAGLIAGMSATVTFPDAPTSR